LPEAHVEAPTFGSIILAGILLKIGSYGFLRFVLPLSFFINIYFFNLIALLNAFSILFISCIAMRQTDLKKIIAYSSIIHMNYTVLGLFVFEIESIISSAGLMIIHGVTSSALFFCVGFLYDKFKTRDLLSMNFVFYDSIPLFCIFFFFFNLSNISFPLTYNFVTELVLLISISKVNIFVAILSLLSILLNLIYTFWVIHALFFGDNSSIKYIDRSFFQKQNFFISDLKKFDFYILFLFFSAIIFLTFFSNVFFENLLSPVLFMLLFK
jgi:NADH-quinone oxidoreductase subunit M